VQQVTAKADAEKKKKVRTVTNLQGRHRIRSRRQGKHCQHTWKEAELFMDGPVIP
jgi:hypothetical protein